MNPDHDRLRVTMPPPAVHDYDVVVRTHALHDARALIERAAPAARYSIIAPDDIAELYAAPLQRALGDRAASFTFAAGEANKTRASWSMLTDAMLARGLGRDTCVIAVGGGVAGDLAGFVAATYMRGIPVVQVPTTLLAMVDASVGGKTGVDTRAGKNLVGAFHAPSLVIIDPYVLGTLPVVQLRAGLAEAVKHGAILDDAYFQRIEDESAALLAADATAMEWLIMRSVELKAGIVAQDPYERGIRAILNFGHTIGHAVEAHAQYRLPHGFAVATGMVAEAALGEAAGVTEPGSGRRLEALLERLGLPVRLPHDAAQLRAYMSVDKKARTAAPRFALLHRIGRAAAAAEGEWTHELPVHVIDDVLKTVSRGADVV
ncbi:MAG TPA: 3-dehydroquinate synthase [Longimicrobiales bacterium]|nr:3-dehydroquinate synthase [Longimicrobiales bacterium]